MKRLKWMILIFCLAISVPLGYVIWHTYQGLAQEERAQLRFFSETLFDGIEQEMADLVRREEDRAVDEYNYTLAQDTGSIRKSPLSRSPGEDYILGYLQNNPDGSFQTPLVADLRSVPTQLRPIVAQLRQVNTVFNQKKLAAGHPPSIERLKTAGDIKGPVLKKEKPAFAERYLSKSQLQESKSYLGQKSARTEEITVGQALNLSREDRDLLRRLPKSKRQSAAPAAAMEEQETAVRTPNALPGDKGKDASDAAAPPLVAPAAERYAFQAEVAPLQSLFISSGRFFIFRRIVINNQIFRQGFVLQVEPFLRHLAANHFNSQPMAAFTGLRFAALTDGRRTPLLETSHWGPASEFITRRTFPAPFDFLSAAMQAAAVPVSPVRRSLNAALVVLGLFMLLGLAAIYQSTRTLVDLSERRSQFVSSVTHELKTPLTNIRMYIEMLEQGIAANPQREQEYMQILGSESARLSRLINNVLELAKLEKKQRRFDLRPGCLQDVLNEVVTIMGHKLRQEGFELTIEALDAPDNFVFDREVLIQILINLIENSIKFGRSAPLKVIRITVARQGQWVRIAVSDSGPGIPRKALEKVFDDFYRVDSDLTRTTGGTGIGLALVKKFVTAMDGHVQAVNNDGPGCTITLLLPSRAVPKP